MVLHKVSMKLNTKIVRIEQFLLFLRKVEDLFEACKCLVVIYSNNDPVELSSFKTEIENQWQISQIQTVVFYTDVSEYPQKNIYFLFSEEGSLYFNFEKERRLSKDYLIGGMIGVFLAAQMFQELEKKCLALDPVSFSKLEKLLGALSLGHENMFLMNQVQRIWDDMSAIGLSR